MSEMQGFGKLFVERSVKMLDTNWNNLKEQDVEVTTLVSCVFSLLCLIESGIEFKLGRTELEKDKFERFFADVPLFYKFNPSEFTENKIITSQVHIIENSILCNDSQNRGFENLIKKIRNSFAHGNILPINKAGKWDAIRAWNRNRNDIIDFIFEVGTEELFGVYKQLASIYKESVK
ncbi:HEPN family nuclease [Hymenobacter nivis]|uniref:HEPN family nuclease n=1 Tax=Hymenobacter nivis TaxID=1850093 RepID=UPI0013A52DBF|nr:HEPN family nuclease [Hymenobacter nivis]